MNLIRILLPLKGNDGLSFPSCLFQTEKEMLTAKFRGLTAFTRTPAQGMWESKNDNVIRDEIVIFEVLADELDINWWGTYRTTLEKTFMQDQIVIMTHSITVL